jgi:4-amino-4-deoxy-L-arabinose transferase-like glycosyltransferase
MRSDSAASSSPGSQGEKAATGGLGRFGALALAFVWLAATLGLRGLTQPDEGRYIGVSWEMLRSGDWVVPTLAGMPFFHKPPLFYWISAASLSVFGLHDWAGRIPSLLGAFGAAVLMFVFARRWSGATTARATLLVLVTQPAFFIGAQFANLDMLVAGCMSMTVLALAHAVLVIDEGQGNARGWVVGAWAAAALGVLAKGIIGFLLPGLVVFIWLCLLRKPKLLIRLLWWPGPLLFLVVAGPWFVTMQMRFAEFFDYFVIEQHFRRFTGTTFNNVRPFWFYLPVLALITLPWSPWLVKAVRRRSQAAPTPLTRSVRLLMWTWAAVIVVFFSLPSSKLIGYVFAALPPLAWLVAEVAGNGLSKAWRASVALAVVLCLVGVGVAARFQPPDAGPLAAELTAHRRGGEPIVMLDRYIYDLGFKAVLGSPVPVVDDWQNPELALHDNWRKELLDAGRFAPAVASHVLIGEPRLRQIVCHAPVAWLAGAKTAATQHPFLAGIAPVVSSGDVALWKVDGNDPRVVAALNCTE